MFNVGFGNRRYNLGFANLGSDNLGLANLGGHNIGFANTGSNNVSALEWARIGIRLASSSRSGSAAQAATTSACSTPAAETSGLFNSGTGCSRHRAAAQSFGLGNTGSTNTSWFNTSGVIPAGATYQERHGASQHRRLQRG